MNWRAILRLAVNDVRLTLRDRAAFFWMLLLPVGMMWLFGQMGASSGGPQRIRLTVVDRDGGWLAASFVRELEADNVELVRLDPADEATTARKVRTLVLPEGFTAAVLAGQQQKLRLHKDDGANREFSLAAEVHIVRAITRTLGLLVEMKQDGTLPAAAAADATADSAASGRFAALSAREPLARLETTTAGRGRPVPGGMAQSVPGILTMTVLMMTVIYGGVFLTLEKRGGMLRRQTGLPLARWQLLSGKLLGRMLVAGMQTVVLLGFGGLVFGVHFGASALGLALLLLCYGFCVAAMSTLCGAILSTPEQASALGWLASMVMAAIGGCWWPSEVMPSWLQRAAHVFPTAWAMDAFHALISFGRGAEAVLVPCAVLVLFGAVCVAIGARYLDAAVS